MVTGCKKDDEKVVETEVDVIFKVRGLSAKSVGYVNFEVGKVYNYSELIGSIKYLTDDIYFQDSFWEMMIRLESKVNKFVWRWYRCRTESN